MKNYFLLFKLFLYFFYLGVYFHFKSFYSIFHIQEILCKVFHDFLRFQFNFKVSFIKILF